MSHERVVIKLYAPDARQLSERVEKIERASRTATGGFVIAACVLDRDEKRKAIRATMTLDLRDVNPDSPFYPSEHLRRSLKYMFKVTGPKTEVQLIAA